MKLKLAVFLVLLAGACLAQPITPVTPSNIPCAGSPGNTIAALGVTCYSGTSLFLCNGATTVTHCAVAADWNSVSGSGSFTALTGDATSTATGGATTVKRINGTSLAGLANGLLKNTTITGVPSIAEAGTDYQAPITDYSTISGLSGYPSTFPPTNSGNWAGTWQTYSPSHFQAALTAYSTISGLSGYPSAFPVTGGSCGSNLVATSISTAAAPTCSSLSSTFLPLSSMGVITGGTWNGGIIASAYGGTGVNNTATLTLGTSNQNWGTLGTGIIKNTTTTGALTIASAGTDYQAPITNYSTISGLTGYPSTFPPTTSGDWSGTWQTHSPAYFQTALTSYSTISGLSGYPSFTSAATTALGTSGAAIPLLSTANTWTLAQTFSQAPTFSSLTSAGTQCAQLSSSGVISGTGSACGSGGGGANVNGYYLVSQSTNEPANAVNLGALTSGLLKIGVSSSIATPATAVANTDYMTVPASCTASGATPTFTLSSLVNTCTETLTASISSITISGGQTGSEITFILTENATGGYTAAAPANFSNWPTIIPTASIATIFKCNTPDGTNWTCGPASSTATYGMGVESAAAGTPPSGDVFCWFDSTDHSGTECKANNSANIFKMVLSGVDVTATSGQVVSTHLSAALPVAQGGTGTQSTLSGLMRGSSSAMTAAELSGDATISGSNSVTVGKVNGVSFPTTGSAFDAIPVLTATNTVNYYQVNGGVSCGDSSHGVSYNATTHEFGCQSITGTSAAGGSNGQVQWNNSTALGGISDWTTNGTTSLTASSGGILNMSSATGTAAFVLPSNTTNTATSAGALVYDTTASNYKANDGADAILGMFPTASVPATGHIVSVTVASSKVTLSDGGVIGTAAAVNTGTSGATVPLLNAANTWTLAQTIAATTNQIVTGTTNTTTLTFPAPASSITLTFPITTEYMIGAASDTTTSHVLHASAVAGVGSFSAIAAADLPGTLSSGTAITNAALTSPNFVSTATATSGAALGTTTNPINNIVMNISGTYGTGSYTFSGTPTANRTLALPDANVTLVSGTMRTTAAIPFDTGANDLTTPTADMSVTFPNTASNGVILAGAAPASVSTATGTNAMPVLTISGVAGGASSNSSGTGGIGSSPAITAGAGGAGTGTNASGGAGGSITFTPGLGGAKTGSGSVGANGSIIFTAAGTYNVDLTNSITTAVASSPTLIFNGEYEATSGPTYGADGWSIQDVVGAGVNGTSTLTFTHSGSTTGAATLGLPSQSIAGASLVNNSVTATQLGNTSVGNAQLAVVQTRRTCVIDNDTQSATALTAAQFSGRCVIPAAATIVEVDIEGGTGTINGTAAQPTYSGTGSVQIGIGTGGGTGSTTNNIFGSTTSLATVSGKNCAITSAVGTPGTTACINGATSSSTAISTSAVAAGEFLYVSAAAADAAQTWYNVTIIYTIN